MAYPMNIPWSPSSAASEDTQVTLPTSNDADILVTDLQKLEDIKFAIYRTAAKLRCLQKHTYLHHIDIWNMIEAFRENGLHSLESSAKISESHIQQLLNSLYDSLQKRLPPTNPVTSSNAGPGSLPASSVTTASPQSIIQTKINLLMSFLWRTLRPTSDKVKVRSLKVVLATLCTGKLMDKLRYIFSHVSDDNGHLIHNRFQHVLRDIMKIPIAFDEYLAFERKEVTEEIFDPRCRVNVNDFLETMMSDPGPQCLSWLLVLHRIINSEHVHHSVTCGNCMIQEFSGLRYKSERSNYHLCQNCFWRGKISTSHIHDVFKEYNSFKTTSGKNSLKKGLHCIPSDKRSSSVVNSSASKHIPRFSEDPEKPLDLSNLVPSMTSLVSNSRSTNDVMMGGVSGGPQPIVRSGSRADDYPFPDEHSMIAQYANQLASDVNPGDPRYRPPSRKGGNSSRRALNHSKQLVHDLEQRNREIMRDINNLRKHRNVVDVAPKDSREIASELSHLRSYKNNLDDRLSELQSTRKELMTELEELMKLLQGQKLSPQTEHNLMFQAPLYD